MKKVFTFIILTIVSASLFAQTEVSGLQSGTWTVDNSPYQVVGQIYVPSGDVLTIEAGVEVNFQGHYKFKVQGNLQAIGTETDNILFTTDNQAVGWGGIRLDGANGISNLAYCRIEYGKTSGSYPDIHGGGLALLTSNAVVSNCVFADNDATGSENGMGGAVYAYNTGSSTRFIDCQFIDNHAYGEGGAIKYTSDNSSEIVGCEFFGNNCFYGGGAISFYSAYNTKMINCLFAENYTEYSSGGALHTLGMGNNLIIQNCTITGNSANHGDGGAISLAYATANIVNSIIYDNQGSYSDGIYVDYSSSATINYSNLTMPDGASGSNNINQNPLFVDANNLDFHLTEASPCIDAGTDIGLEYFGETPDMGCFEWFISDSEDIQIAEFQSTIRNYPNPFNPETTIEFKIPTRDFENAHIEIYNVKGQKIKELRIANYEFGMNEVIWKGDDDSKKTVSSGVYFYNLNVDGKILSMGRCLLLK